MGEGVMTIDNFLVGEPLHYLAPTGALYTATYRAGIGIELRRAGKTVAVARVTDDVGAVRVWHHLVMGDASWPSH
jgi:hypothetical protein